MALTAEQKALRAGKITASAVGALMEGDDAKVFNLWCELTGNPRYVGTNLDDVWAVQLGSYSELLNLHWYARQNGYGPLIKKATFGTDDKGNLVMTSCEVYPENAVKKLGEVIVHPDYHWAAATLDAWDSKAEVPLVVECKHCGNFRKMPDIIAKYTPQLHWQMFVTGTKKAKLRVIIGANEPTDLIVEWDDFYWSTMWVRVLAFWEQVTNKIEPRGGTEAVAVSFEPSKYRTIDLDEEAMDHNWSGDMIVHLDVWIETNNAADRNEKAVKGIKDLLPADVGTLTHVHEDGKGRVTVKRNVKGAVSITSK